MSKPGRIVSSYTQLKNIEVVKLLKWDGKGLAAVSIETVRNSL